MTREEQTDLVWRVLIANVAAGGAVTRRLAERIVDALQPAEDTSDSTQAKVDRMRDLTERVSERNQRIERLKHPGETSARYPRKP